MATKKRRKKQASVKKKASNPKIEPKKKRSNPKITARKKDPKRVKAGKKGWKTRKKRVQDNQVKAVKKRAEEILDVRVLKMSREELLKELEKTQRKLALEAERRRVLEITQKWVPYFDKDQLHLGKRGHQSYPRGSIALQPSRARTLPEPTIAELLRRMRKANKESEDELDGIVHDIADETGFTVREIYTLWFSP